MWGHDGVEAGGPGGEKNFPRRIKGDRRFLNPPQGWEGRRLDSRGEAVCSKAVDGAVFLREKVRTYGDVWHFAFLVTTGL